MKKKIISKLAALAMAFLMIGSPLYAHAHIEAENWYPFHFSINDVSKGYTYTIAREKKANYPLYWVDVKTNSLGTNVPTNFIVIATDGRQVAENVIINGCTSGYNRYYAAKHAGLVYLRANSGSTVVGYRITGEWSQNAFNCGC